MAYSRSTAMTYSKLLKYLLRMKIYIVLYNSHMNTKNRYVESI
jgi:hypothetical protein